MRPGPEHGKPRSASRASAATEEALLSEVIEKRRQGGQLHDALVRQQLVPRSLLDPQALLGQGSAPPPTFHSTFFGTFALYRGDVRLSLGRSKPQLELCRYLVARAGQMVPRDELIDLLWPDVPPDRAVHRLHVSISGLRHLLGEPDIGERIVQLGDDSYSVAGDAVLTDCSLFERYHRRGRACLPAKDYQGAESAFRDALELYQGDYLADHPYAEWTHEPRAHFRDLRLDALTFLCEQAMLEDDLVAVVDYAREILTVDNLREFPHRLLMRAHYRMGQRACAIRQFISCAEYLRQELGVAPSQETQRLYRAICDDSDLPQERHIRL